MANKDNTILWVVGIILFVIVAQHVNILGNFAIITKTTCIDNKISYYDMNSGTVPGILGKGIEFRGNNSINVPVDSGANAVVMWVKNYSNRETHYTFLAQIGNLSYVNTVQSNVKHILPLGPQFGLGLNGSVDEVGTFSNLSLATLQQIYNNGVAREICYTTSYEENVTCKDYALSKVTDTGTGCLNYSGTVFPNCKYNLVQDSVYNLVNNQCHRTFLCNQGTLSITTCEAQIIPVANTTTPNTSAATSTISTGTDSGLYKPIVTIAGYQIKVWHLLIIFLLVLGILYANKQ